MNEDRKAKTMDEAYNKEGARKAKWATFVETSIADFFNQHELEKMTLEDGDGNKAKLSRMKDNGIKVEHSTTTII